MAKRRKAWGLARSEALLTFEQSTGDSVAGFLDRLCKDFVPVPLSILDCVLTTAAMLEWCYARASGTSPTADDLTGVAQDAARAVAAEARRARIGRIGLATFRTSDLSSGSVGAWQEAVLAPALGLFAQLRSVFDPRFREVNAMPDDRVRAAALERIHDAVFAESERLASSREAWAVWLIFWTWVHTRSGCRLPRSAASVEGNLVEALQRSGAGTSPEALAELRHELRVGYWACREQTLTDGRVDRLLQHFYAAADGSRHLGIHRLMDYAGKVARTWPADEGPHLGTGGGADQLDSALSEDQRARSGIVVGRTADPADEAAAREVRATIARVIREWRDERDDADDGAQSEATIRAVLGRWDGTYTSREEAAQVEGTTPELMRGLEERIRPVLRARIQRSLGSEAIGALLGVPRTG